ncbi:MAG: hypothetical protein FWB80_15120 [Defluviitaleaceae bacterium]|nr:hypothetical protein [Defluviitaleaceae bacterium]
MQNKNNPVLSKKIEVKIGRVNYIVTSHYKEYGRETADQKYLRYVSSRVAEELKSPKTPAIAAV